MTSITDDYLREVIKTGKPWTLVVFKSGPKADEVGAEKIIWEHGRRNLELLKAGTVNMIIAVRDGWEIEGLDVFNRGVDETRKIMEKDPAVKAGVLTYEIHPTTSFSRDAVSG